jgi:hypothetical protein
MVCASPEHFAATHVLHRLLAPRHPPSALRSLTKKVLSTFAEKRIDLRFVLPRHCFILRLDPEIYLVVKDRSSGRAEALPPVRGGRPQEGRAEKSRKPIGGADRDRTDDLRLAKPALSQLSYSPSSGAGGWWAWADLNCRPPAYQADALTN